MNHPRGQPADKMKGVCALCARDPANVRRKEASFTLLGQGIIQELPLLSSARTSLTISAKVPWIQVHRGWNHAMAAVPMAMISRGPQSLVPSTPPRASRYDDSQEKKTRRSAELETSDAITMDPWPGSREICCRAAASQHTVRFRWASVRDHAVQQLALRALTSQRKPGSV